MHGFWSYNEIHYSMLNHSSQIAEPFDMNLSSDLFKYFKTFYKMNEMKKCLLFIFQHFYKLSV